MIIDINTGVSLVGEQSLVFYQRPETGGGIKSPDDRRVCEEFARTAGSSIIALL
jgi:hypothetical protein